jgi:hypothetical protein
MNAALSFCECRGSVGFMARVGYTLCVYRTMGVGHVFTPMAAIVATFDDFGGSSVPRR